MSSKDFLGSGLSFPLSVDPATGKIAIVSYEEDIAQAIGIILKTYRGERVMRPDFGGVVADYVFSPMSQTVQESIAFELRQQLTLQEPRIVDITVLCNTGRMSELNVNIEYTVRSTNNRYNRVYPFYTEEGESA